MLASLVAAAANSFTTPLASPGNGPRVGNGRCGWPVDDDAGRHVRGLGLDQHNGQVVVGRRRAAGRAGHCRLRETTPGTYGLDHDASGHDDRAVALGLAALA